MILYRIILRRVSDWQLITRLELFDSADQANIWFHSQGQDFIKQYLWYGLEEVKRV